MPLLGLRWRVHERGFRAFRRRRVLFALLAAQPAFAELSKEAAIEQCRMSVGRPIVMACMQGGGGSLEACRVKATPKVKACVMAKLQAANSRANVAVAVPTEAAPKLVPGMALPAGFVAPPRTISDITRHSRQRKAGPQEDRGDQGRRRRAADRQGIEGGSRAVLFRPQQRARRPGARGGRDCGCQQGARGGPGRPSRPISRAASSF